MKVKKMDEQVKYCDKEITKIAKKVEKYSLQLINPLNADKEKQNFFFALHSNNIYSPCFKYEKAKSFKKEKQSLNLLEKELKNCVCSKILLERINSLKTEITLLESVNTKNFCHNSKEQYGKPKSAIIKIAKEIISKKIIPEHRNITPIEMKQKLMPLVEKTGFSISLEKNMSARATVNLVKKKLKLHSGALFSENDANRLFVHEVETHIYRHLNGLTQPLEILSLGVGGEYLLTEEGLAAFNEEQSGILSDAQKKIFAGRLYAVDYALRHDFFETFEEMKRFFDDENAYIITQRVKRGILQEKKGAFTKDHCYFSGLVELKKKFPDKLQLRDLYYGKVSLSETKMVKKISGINPAKYLPRALIKNN